jgi:hypothetical protein
MPAARLSKLPARAPPASPGGPWRLRGLQPGKAPDPSLPRIRQQRRRPGRPGRPVLHRRGIRPGALRLSLDAICAVFESPSGKRDLVFKAKPLKLFEKIRLSLNMEPTSPAGPTAAPGPLFSRSGVRRQVASLLAPFTPVTRARRGLPAAAPGLPPRKRIGQPPPRPAFGKPPRVPAASSPGAALTAPWPTAGRRRGHRPASMLHSAFFPVSDLVECFEYADTR